MSDPFKLWFRILLAVWGGLLFGLLATAAWLEPDPSGQGTHQQLGFPECSVMALWGKPCPACGMTTSWSHVMHGNFLLAAKTNLGGALLAILALMAVPTCMTLAWTGRASKKFWVSRFYAVTLVIALATAIVIWIARFFGS